MDRSPDTPPPRQLVLLCDGTNNTLSGRLADTHVVLLAELLRRFPDGDGERLIYYDPGVGNPGVLPGTTWIDSAHRKQQRLFGLAFGRGLYDNVAEGYRFLMANWRPGDQVFLFGFSRGAFTARSIGGMVNAFGIVDGHQDTLVDSLVATYFAPQTRPRRAVQQQAARLFGQDRPGESWPMLHFVGVWDTVASVGVWPFALKITASPDLAGKHFRHVRQALALDEQRASYQPRAYAQDDGPFALADGSGGDVRQRWFRGAHCDVGGGYLYADSELSRTPFAWLAAEAMACGLRLSGLQVQPGEAGEDAVRRVLPLLDPPCPPRRPARVSSQTSAMPLWALAGLQVRDTRHAAIDGRPGQPVAMQAHPSVAAWQAVFPAGTAWCGGWIWRHWKLLVLALVFLAVFVLQAGEALHVPPQGAAWGARFAAAQQANWALACWQGSLATMQAWRATALAFDHPFHALGWDLPLIVAYACLLSMPASWAFARCAGLVRFGQRVPGWLRSAGWALPLMVAADLAEDGLTALAFALLLHWPQPGAVDGILHGVPLPALQALLLALRVLVWLASAAKWAGLAGVAGLFVAGGLKRQERQLAGGRG
ncbi:DUF2235 domain-containing protein [Pseudorhodoferax sp.]|uniref:DUF2235 domain-containing protein n=1 Tax=Pseudorhodoferax sp. TaxID=1993553 RepID=UPI0039E2CA47